MNLLPVPPHGNYDLGQTRELTSAVAPARKPGNAANEREQAARDQASQVLNAIQREALVSEYVGLGVQAQPAGREQQGRRAVAAYESVALQDKRDILADMLGVSEYA